MGKNIKVEFTDGIPTSLHVSFGMKVNTGNYESVNPTAGFSMELKEGADLDRAFEQAFNFVEAIVLEKAKEHLGND